MSRRRLPNRRLSKTFELMHRDLRHHVSIGYYSDTLKAGEVFARGPKAGSMMEAVLSDACTLMSLLLQYGASPEEIARAMARNMGPPATILGAIADLLAAQKTLDAAE